MVKKLSSYRNVVFICTTDETNETAAALMQHLGKFMENFTEDGKTLGGTIVLSDNASGVVSKWCTDIGCAFKHQTLGVGKEGGDEYRKLINVVNGVFMVLKPGDQRSTIVPRMLGSAGVRIAGIRVTGN